MRLGPPRSSARPRPAPPEQAEQHPARGHLRGAPRPGRPGRTPRGPRTCARARERSAWALRPGTPGLAALGGRPLPACLPPAVARSGPPAPLFRLRCALRLRESERLCRSLGAASLRATVTRSGSASSLHPPSPARSPSRNKTPVGLSGLFR